MDLSTLLRAGRSVAEGLVGLGRLHALGLLADGPLPAKRERARKLAAAVDQASAIADFMLRYYQEAYRPVEWQSNRRPDASGALSARQVDVSRLEEEIAECTNTLASTVAWLLAELHGNGLLSPAEPIFASTARLLPPADSRAPRLGPVHPPAPASGCVKAVDGPLHVGLDPAFEPTYSLLQQPLPAFGETPSEVAPYLWALSVRETLAAELCALSVLEYDGLPIAFYCDFAKQCWDEMRHATFFLDAAVDLLEDLESSLVADDPLLENLDRFHREGRGLPIPRERNLYEAILNATLEERLILLHMDTETPGIARIRAKLKGQFCKEHHGLAEALKVILRDEITHAMLGRRWLAHLIPDHNARRQTIQETELLRGVRLLASFAHHGPDRLSVLMARYSLASTTQPPSSVGATTV